MPAPAAVAEKKPVELFDMGDYRTEQLAALRAAIRYIQGLSTAEIDRLKRTISDYLEFRKEVDAFLDDHFADICTRTCFESELSACCSKDGIITFFADILINTLHASPAQIEALIDRLENPAEGFKCVYLAKNGCLMRIQPIVCKMFLCDRAEKEVFRNHPQLKSQWEDLKEKKKRFTWPDRPVLFDFLEELALKAGLSSPLMYMHTSPGLLRVKQNAQKTVKGRTDGGSSGS